MFHGPKKVEPLHYSNGSTNKETLIPVFNPESRLADSNEANSPSASITAMIVDSVEGQSKLCRE